MIETNNVRKCKLSIQRESGKLYIINDGALCYYGVPHQPKVNQSLESGSKESIARRVFDKGEIL